MKPPTGKNGVYRLHWNEGGYSLAAVGTLYDGRRWYAASNWTSECTCGIVSIDWGKVKCAELVEAKT